MRFVLIALFAAALAGADEFGSVREQGASLEAQRNWKAAAALYESALPGTEAAVCGSEGFWLLTSLSEMAFNETDYGTARRWLASAEDCLGPKSGDSPGRIRLLNARAALHLAEGKLSAAQRDLNLAAAVALHIKDTEATAAICHNLASVEMQTGRLELARKHELHALGLWQQEFGERHEDVFRAWVGLSSIQGLLREWAAAERSLRRALQIAQTPDALHNLAVVLEHLGRRAEARQIRERLGDKASNALPANSLVDVRSLAAGKQQIWLTVR